MANNELRVKATGSIMLRDERRGPDFWPCRNIFGENRFDDKGPGDGVAIGVSGRARVGVTGKTCMIYIRDPAARISMRTGPELASVRLAHHAGFGKLLLDHRLHKAGQSTCQAPRSGPPRATAAASKPPRAPLRLSSSPLPGIVQEAKTMPYESPKDTAIARTPS